MNNVLFLLGHFGVGGVERVTTVLAAELARRGHGVTICAFKIDDRALLTGLDGQIVVRELGEGWMCAANREVFRKIVLEQMVDVVINQWAVPYAVTRFVRRATMGLNVRLIAVHHNLPTTNKRIQDAPNGLIRAAWKLVSAINARLVYSHSDRYVVLSPSFIPLFKRFIWHSCADRVCAIPNPLTMTVPVRPKENVILYVGRLEETQKRVSRIIGAWRTLAGLLPDWRLEVVGDGPDRGKYELMAKDLPRIAFKGFCDPAEHYARAKMLLLTSDFEGFGLVLVEAMAAGCVPIALGSYLAVHDIIADNKDGRILSMPYEERKLVDAVLPLTRDAAAWARMSVAAQEKSKSFALDRILRQWSDLLSAGQ